MFCFNKLKVITMKNALLFGSLIGLKVFSQNVIVNGKNIRIELTVEKNSKGYHTLFNYIVF